MSRDPNPLAVCGNVIFDLDGTLVDSKPGIVAGLRHALAQLGHDLPAEEALDWAIGPPLDVVVARLLAPLGDGRVREAVACYREWYGSVGLYDAVVYAGVVELLDRLVTAEKSLFVATSKRTSFARRVLEHFGLAAHFRAVYGAEPHGRFDRKSELIHHLLTTEGLDAAATVLVGDREHDVAAARANGLRVVGVTYGYGGHEELVSADALCGSAAEVQLQLGLRKTPE
jgi:phosphoglycolate phosphatase